ncbi:hypothetical protein GCM10010413_52090 [Promicromonospora sukumoe]|uniref:Uncharacterized protein n=1 Tax=Promicromonospora sukumoe TaxID=88382 RepID=A0A7W3JD57_9MICO|nr:hypothetical protein [Promicromonospora sukumoe]MBA8810654.1 hypothetical protein [Promicromonospora sukumoe]
MPQMWTVSHRLRWTPILTFGMRRLRLLEWLEKNTSPVAFADEGEGHIGISLVDRSLKLVIGRSHADISSSAADLSIDNLEPALAGLFEVFEPESCVLTATDSVWTSEIDSTDYNEERAGLASAMTGVMGSRAGFRAVDASALVDFESMEHTAQVEFGIIDDKELRDRLSDPRMGRISGRRPVYEGLFPEQVPSVALLADVALRRKVGGTVTSAQDVITSAADEVRTIDSIVSMLVDGQGKGRDSGEHIQTG